MASEPSLSRPNDGGDKQKVTALMEIAKQLHRIAENMEDNR